jgi:outer membrane protein assembly factor BamB
VKKALIALAALVLILVGAGAAYVLYKRSQGGNIRGNSTVEFVTTRQKTTRAQKHAAKQGIAWPTYGFDQQRTRVGPSRFRPPFRLLWVYRGKSLLEFPPSIGYGRLYFTNNSGTTTALDARTGKRVWRRVEHHCTAASPAIAGGLVFQTFLNRPPCNATGSSPSGLLIAYGAKTGKIVWRRVLGPSETSPLVVGHRVYVGDWRGKIYAFETKSGHLDWSYSTGGPVKGGIAYDGGRVFAGSYDHHVYALRAKSGKLVWSSSAQQRFGALANFYSTPALAYGRLYIGGTDGKVYSYGAADGRLLWTHGTASYVYASPAVWRRYVFAGSYDGTFYAFDAATGDVRWSFSANGPISGSPTVLHGVVYFATLKERTYALSARNGTKVWGYQDGKYSPVVADSKRLYLVGHTRIYAMVPRRTR